MLSFLGAGLIYLLCLPSSYLFLTIYAVCNLDDRSWGTREEKKKAAKAGQSFLDTFLTGCGRQDKESLWHFLGRVLCCRCRQASEDRSNGVHPYAILSEAPREERLADWRLEEGEEVDGKGSSWPLSSWLRLTLLPSPLIPPDQLTL